MRIESLRDLPHTISISLSPHPSLPLYLYLPLQALLLTLRVAFCMSGASIAEHLTHAFATGGDSCKLENGITYYQVTGSV